MARGFVAGAMIGAVVSVVGAGTLSLVVGPPPRDAVIPDPVPLETDALPPGGVATAPVRETPGPDAVQHSAPPEPIPTEDVAPPPETATPQGDGAVPAWPSEPDMTPPQPVDAADPAPAVQPSTRPRPMTPPEPIADARTDSGAPEPDMAAPTVDSTGPVLPPAPVPADRTGAPAASETAAGARDGAAVSPSVAGEDPSPVVSTATPTPPLPAPMPDIPERSSGLPVIGAPDGDAVGETPRPPAGGVAIGIPSIGAPAGSLVDRDGGVPRRRLPRIAGTSDAPAETASDDQPPLERYAAAVTLPEGEPVMSVVLIDDGSGPLGPDTVGELPFPVSFAISPSHPDARAAAQAYRAGGFEVLALAGVPDGAQASDVEINLEGALGAVPEAIGVLENPAGGLQGSRGVSEQAAEFLRDSGHGLLMLPKGLGTGEALARRVGVPTATVFRDFDGSGQDPRVMRRFLDQAAFRARQEGAVVMLGRLRADTVSALLLWGLQDRASSIALVPVSAILTRDGAPG
ncbi:divergent polysaccharide deacetylase family protein [Salipiger aestuarii]|uniref:divergent polysaccharide deacetylase family protein n=1 Tax=Salipiger aestuarii TaxID=568098 RepID=UPI00168163D2|nr:divergent polysaccharide deacetylase family protein [Salipiger aestuarii]